MTKKEIAEKQEAIEYLKNMFTKYDVKTVYTILRHVSASGMYRAIDMYIIAENTPLRITWSACKVMGQKYDKKHEAAGISGCGMDMGFNLVYNLSVRLYCPDAYDHDKAYYLEHRWL